MASLVFSNKTTILKDSEYQLLNEIMIENEVLPSIIPSDFRMNLILKNLTQQNEQVINSLYDEFIKILKEHKTGCFIPSTKDELISYINLQYKYKSYSVYNIDTIEDRYNPIKFCKDTESIEHLQFILLTGIMTVNYKINSEIFADKNFYAKVIVLCEKINDFLVNRINMLNANFDIFGNYSESLVSYIEHLVNYSKKMIDISRCIYFTYAHFLFIGGMLRLKSIRDTYQICVDNQNFHNYLIKKLVIHKYSKIEDEKASIKLKEYMNIAISENMEYNMSHIKKIKELDNKITNVRTDTYYSAQAEKEKDNTFYTYENGTLKSFFKDKNDDVYETFTFSKDGKKHAC